MKNFITVVLCLILFSGLKAQEEKPLRIDQEFWMSFGLEKSILKKGVVFAEWARRFEDHRTYVKNTFVEFGAEYEVLQNVDFGISFRRVDRGEEKEQRDRLSLIAKYKIKLYNFNLSYRLKGERTWEDFNPTTNRIRNRIMLKSKWDQLYCSPFVSAEIFYTKNEEFDAWSRYRYKAGIAGEILKNHSLSVAFILQKDLNERKPMQDEVWSVAYQLKF